MKLKKALINAVYNHRFKKLGIKHGKNCAIAKDVANSWGKAKITLGDNVILHSGIVFAGDGEITIGNHTSIGANTWIYCSKEAGVSIGSYTTIGPFSFLIDSDHGLKKDVLIEKQPKTFGKIFIGDDCWLGTHVVVTKNTYLSDHCAAGALTLLNKKYEENSIIGGVPGKVIKNRS